MKHLINWIEIPATDLQRAMKFYADILGSEFHQMQINDLQYALFPSENAFNCGALVQGSYYTPSADGVVIYLDGGNNLNIILSKVNAAGGQVIMEKMFLSKEAGYIGMFIDSEGNKIGLQHL